MDPEGPVLRFHAGPVARVSRRDAFGSVTCGVLIAFFLLALQGAQQAHRGGRADPRREAGRVDGLPAGPSADRRLSLYNQRMYYR